VYCAVALTAASLLASSAAWPQGWTPQRNVELIVPSGVGGSLDTTARVVQTVWNELKLVPTSSTVVNRVGGGHTIAYNFLNQQTGNAHYLSITAAALLTGHINGRSALTHTDFTPVATLMTEYLVIAVRADSPIRTGRDLVDALKNNPSALSVGLGSAAGGPHHIALGLTLQSAGVDATKIKLVSFKSAAETVTRLLGGHVEVASSSPITVGPHVESGKLRVLAVSSPKRLRGVLSGAPTWPELGYSGVFEHWRAVIGPKGITAEQIAYWEGILRSVTQHDTFKRYCEKNQLDITFKGSTETRRSLESHYKELESAMNFLQIAKR
jgi:putative tricarboxylic transport membrane protein